MLDKWEEEGEEGRRAAKERVKKGALHINAARKFRPSSARATPTKDKASLCAAIR